MLELGVKFLISYFIGSIMGAMVIGKLRGGIDIRTMGSGNAGGTNALRIYFCGRGGGLGGIDSMDRRCAAAERGRTSGHLPGD